MKKLNFENNIEFCGNINILVSTECLKLQLLCCVTDSHWDICGLDLTIFLRCWISDGHDNCYCKIDLQIYKNS